MPLVHRHIAKKSKEPTTSLSEFQTCSAFRIVTRAQEANQTSIRVPEPVAMHNSYSSLNDTVTSDSSIDSVESNTDSDMPSRNESNDGGDEYSDTDYSDMPPLIESNENENVNNSSDNSSDNSNQNTSDSDEEIIMNHTRYQRVRKSCKDHLPCPITYSFTLWAIAIFMQCIFQLCGLTNDKCSRTL